jgi:hypothetical protein
VGTTFLVELRGCEEIGPEPVSEALSPLSSIDSRRLSQLIHKLSAVLAVLLGLTENELSALSRADLDGPGSHSGACGES